MLWCIVTQCDVSSNLVTAVHDVMLNDLGTLSVSGFKLVGLQSLERTDMCCPASVQARTSIVVRS